MHQRTSATPTDTPVHRAEVEALVTSVRPHDPYPAWARLPESKAEFLASLVLHAEREHWPLTVEYDEHGVATDVRGVRLREVSV